MCVSSRAASTSLSNFPKDEDAVVAEAPRVRAAPKKRKTAADADADEDGAAASSSSRAASRAAGAEVPGDNPFHRTSQFPRQVWVVRDQLWRASVRKFGAPKTVGKFSTPLEAALAQDAYVLLHHLESENALNFGAESESAKDECDGAAAKGRDKPRSYPGAVEVDGDGKDDDGDGTRMRRRRKKKLLRRDRWVLPRLSVE